MEIKCEKCHKTFKYKSGLERHKNNKKQCLLVKIDDNKIKIIKDMDDKIYIIYFNFSIDECLKIYDNDIIMKKLFEIAFNIAVDMKIIEPEQTDKKFIDEKKIFVRIGQMEWDITQLFILDRTELAK